MSKTTTDKTPKTVYMTDEMIEALERVAEEHDTSFSDTAEQAIMHTLHQSADDDWYAHMRREQLQQVINTLEEERDALPAESSPPIPDRFLEGQGFPE